MEFPSGVNHWGDSEMEGFSSKPMMSPITMRRTLASGALLLTAGLTLMPGHAYAQTPSNVLLFPAVVDGDRSDSTKLAEEIVTEAVRHQLGKLGIAAVVYISIYGLTMGLRFASGRWRSIKLLHDPAHEAAAMAPIMPGPPQIDASGAVEDLAQSMAASKEPGGGR